jgi:23S rRNA (guanosine2251-2'-O)-methyltransferase
MAEPEFQIYQCSNEQCRFRCPNNLTERLMEHCPLCGAKLIPQGRLFINSKRSSANPVVPGQPAVIIDVLLDNLRSTLNVGSIFRTADGAGVNHIYCCGTTPTPQHAKIAKTSLGAEGFTPWSYHPNALDQVKFKRDSGYQIISMEAADSSKSLFTTAPASKRSPTLLVLGNEVSGIDPEIIQFSDQVLYIPMQGKKSSLNVAVAFGIAVYTLLNNSHM